MKKILFLALLMFILVLYGCGGGGAKITQPPAKNPPAANGGGNTAHPPITVAEAAAGMPSSGYVPDEVLVKSGVDKETLAGVVEKYGYELVYKNKNYAKVKVPDGNLPAAISKLSREQSIFDVTVNGEFRMPTQAVPFDTAVEKARQRVASFTPIDAMYGDTYVDPGWTTDPSAAANDQRYFLGNRMFLDMASVPGAWDLSMGAGTTVAVIDGGMLEVLPTGGTTYLDLFIHAEYMDNNAGTLEIQRLSPLSAKVLADGSFTTIQTDPEAVTNVITGTIYRTAADGIFGVISSNINFNINYPIYAPGNAPPNPEDRLYPTSIPGVAPLADYLMVATGTIDTGAANPVWVFTADEIAAAITYAVDNGADVIVMGMWSPVADFTPADVVVMQDAVNYARANDVAIIAPVGSDRDTTTGAPYYDPGDPLAVPPIPPSFNFINSFTAADFYPASLTGVISVGSTGVSTPNVPFSIFGGLEAYNEGPRTKAGYCADSANIYATGFALSTEYLNLNNDNSLNWYAVYIGPDVSAAYVAGTVLLEYSALRIADPAITDIDGAALNILMNGSETNVDQLLQAARVVAIANNGGYDLIYPALDVGFTLPVDPAAVETNSPFSVDPTVADGQGPYEILIDWGDGTTYPVNGQFEPYVDGTIYNKDTGYARPDFYGITVFIRDTRLNIASAVANILVSNPLSALPYVTDITGGQPITGLPGDPIPLSLGVDYVCVANSMNLLTGSLATFTWDFGDGSPVSNEENPIHTYSGTGGFTVILTVDDGIRPVVTRTFDVQVT